MPKTFRKLAGACARLEGWGRAIGFSLMLRDASQRIWAAEAPALASRCDAPQHEGEGAPRVLAKRSQAGVLRASVLACLVRAKHQPAAVRNDGRRRFPVSGLFFTGNGATATCRGQGGAHVAPSS